MRKDKEKAFELRRQKMSYKNISQELNIPIGTLAGWFKDESWSQEIRDELGTKESLAFPEKMRRIVDANRKKWKALYLKWQNEAIIEFETLKNNPLFISGIMLYWGEGDKKLENGSVSLSNSDPEMVKIFHRFLFDIAAVPKEKIRAKLIIYPDLTDSVLKNIWSRLTKIPVSQFTKSAVIQGRHPTRRNSYGVCLLRIGSRELKEKILKWIELYQNYLASPSIENGENLA